MLPRPINHSPDLKKLREEGFEIEQCDGFLRVHHIPYLDSNRTLKYGMLVSELTLASPLLTGRPLHTIYFVGSVPCHKDGTPINEIIHTSADQQFGGLLVNHFFSSKPQIGYYCDYHEKITSYINILIAPARAISGNFITAQTYRAMYEKDEESVFEYPDTNSSRANINLINSKFNGQKIGIVGLGGTGAYILDLVSKTPVQEIHLFDGDILSQHNAFRSPGAISADQLDRLMQKVDYYAETYSKMHKNIVPHQGYIHGENITCLENLSFVFICVDKDSARKCIMGGLLRMGISFIDVGLGVNIVDDVLIGQLRATSGSTLKNDHLAMRVSLSDNDDDNEYATNIQVADLNAMNAVMAVIKWKKSVGFYQDLKEEHHSTYSINTSQLINEEYTT